MGPAGGRAFFSPEVAGGDMILVVTNLLVAPTGSIQSELFSQAPTLDGWTARLERSMHSNDIEYTLLEVFPRAKVYATVTLGHLGLNGYVVDGGQPVTIALQATAQKVTLEPLDQLRSSGVLSDFMTMVESVHAIPEDATNISPPID